MWTRAREAWLGRLGLLVEHIWLLLVLAAAWWFVSAGSSSFFFPPLQAILETLGRDLRSGPLPLHLLYSLANLAVGMALASLTGVVLGLFIGELDHLRRVIGPILYFMRAIPASAIVPIVIIMFGLGPGPKIAIIAFACTWPILLNTIDGVRGIPPSVRELVRAYRIPPLLAFRRVTMWGAMPQIMVGLRIALGIGISVMVISELFGANAGIGYYILSSSQNFALPETWGGTLLVGAVGYGLSSALLFAEREILSWYFQRPGKTRREAST